MANSPDPPRGDPAPDVGSSIYVESSIYSSHGKDDFCGGLCHVETVTVSTVDGKPTWMITVIERPGHSYNWERLRKKQTELKSCFGSARGYPDPNLDPSANDPQR